MSGSGAVSGRRLDRSAKRLLVADDADTYRSIALRVLGDAGYQVAGASDGAEALRLIQKEPVDLLVLELNLPKMRGLDLLRRIRESPRLQGIRVLAVSELLTAHLRRVLSDLRIDSTLTKNHALRDLLYQVDSLLFPSASNERKTPRKLGQLPVNYWAGDRLYVQSCFDLSEEGMFVATTDEEPPPAGTRLAMRFWLPTSDRLIACESEVMWINTAVGDLRITHPPGMGVKFTRIEEVDRRLVREFLERRG